MADQNIKKLLDEALSPIKKQLNGLQNGQNSLNVGLVKIEKRLDDPKTGLKRINDRLDVLWEQTATLTEDMAEVKETLDVHSTTLNTHTAVLKTIELSTQNSADNINKLDKRVQAAEDHLGIVPSPELTIIRYK